MDSAGNLEGFKELVKGWLTQKFILEFGRYPNDKELEKLMSYLYHNGGMASSISLKGILETS